jgi:hypothetical protein
VSRKSKLKFYWTVIRPIVVYGCETWVLKESIIQRHSVFERKIFGPTKVDNSIWRIKTNMELEGEFCPHGQNWILMCSLQCLGVEWFASALSVVAWVGDGGEGKEERKTVLARPPTSAFWKSRVCSRTLRWRGDYEYWAWHTTFRTRWKFEIKNAVMFKTWKLT